VDYALTDLGKMLMVPLRALNGWAVKHRLSMLAARKKVRGEGTPGCGAAETLQQP